MGNGEEYIWKPPEDDDIAMFQPKPPCPLNPPSAEGGGHQVLSAVALASEVYSKVSKTLKKKRPTPGSPPPNRDNNGHRTLAREGASAGFSVVVKPQSWSGGAQQEDPCYEAIGDKVWPAGGGAAEESDPAYEAVDAAWKRERPPNATLKPRKKKPTQPPQQPPPPVKGPTAEVLYESISDVRQGLPTSSTTTIFTFNDGMEMYVTGL
ncbi:hypothetical protein Z043_124130 [Scleropages formosus]|uniref:Uncharacterized protein n=1 Tax=Scleropages formosus TaxID=113540 RepID=A0A0P7UCR4_SCLFO|nr:hypothetical protein Z043_124130 [Scleropages formosus]